MRCTYHYLKYSSPSRSPNSITMHVYTQAVGTPTRSQHNIWTRKNSHKLFPTLKSTQSEGTLRVFLTITIMHFYIINFFYFFLILDAAIAIYNICNIFGTDKAFCCSTHIDFAKVSSNALICLSNFHNLGKPFPLPLVLYSNFFKNVTTIDHFSHRIQRHDSPHVHRSHENGRQTEMADAMHSAPCVPAVVTKQVSDTRQLRSAYSICRRHLILNTEFKQKAG